MIIKATETEMHTCMLAARELYSCTKQDRLPVKATLYTRKQNTKKRKQLKRSNFTPIPGYLPSIQQALQRNLLSYLYGEVIHRVLLHLRTYIGAPNLRKHHKRATYLLSDLQWNTDYPGAR